MSRSSHPSLLSFSLTFYPFFATHTIHKKTFKYLQKHVFRTRTCTPPRIHTSLHSIAFICSYGYIKKYVLWGGNLIFQILSPFFLPRSGSWEQNIFPSLFSSPKYGSVHCKVTLSVNSVPHSRLRFGCHVRLSSQFPRPWRQQKCGCPYHSPSKPPCLSSRPPGQVWMVERGAVAKFVLGWKKCWEKKKKSYQLLVEVFQHLTFPGSSGSAPIYEGSLR